MVLRSVRYCADEPFLRGDVGYTSEAHIPLVSDKEKASKTWPEKIKILPWYNFMQLIGKRKFLRERIHVRSTPWTLSLQSHSYPNLTPQSRHVISRRHGLLRCPAGENRESAFQPLGPKPQLCTSLLEGLWESYWNSFCCCLAFNIKYCFKYAVLFFF